MSLYDCLQRAIDSGDMPRARAQRVQEMFRERMQEHASLGPGAEAAASEDVWLQLRREHQRKKRGAYMQIERNAGIIDQITRFRDSNGKANAANAIRQLVEWGQSASFTNVASIRQALESSYLRDIGSLIDQHKRNIFGNVRNKARLPNIVRELHGEATGDANAKSVADAVRGAFERARREFNAAGGDLGRLEDFGLPHHWDQGLVSRASREEFTAQMDARVDWDRVIDHNTSKPFSQSSASARANFLGEIYENIKHGGAHKREPSGMSVGRSVANRRADPRILHFKSADDWMAVNEIYGKDNPFAAIVTHLKGMAGDTAQMRVLGPNPSAGLQVAIQTAGRLAAERPWVPDKLMGAQVRGKGVPLYKDASSEVRAKGRQAQRMLDMMTGASNTPEMDVVASALSGTRHFLIASQLGGAMLSAVSDLGFMAMASRHVGMSRRKVFGRVIKNLVSSDSRAMLARAGIIAEAASNTGVMQARMLGDAYGPASMEKLSEFTMRASGLTAWTDMNRGVFQLEFYGMLADNASRSWDQLDKPLRELVFEPRGITREDWEVIRGTELYKDTAQPDAAFLIPDDIRRRTDIDPDVALDLSLKLNAAIKEQMEFAIPAASLRGRATVDLGTSGSAGGEFSKSALMYKNFTLSLMYNQLGRIFHHKVNGSRAANIAMFATFTTAAGALSMQLKDVARGNDPRDMTDWKFWKAAMIQGGGLGIFGDFLYSTENRFGGGFGSTVAGPVVGFANDAGSLLNTIGSAMISDDPKKTDRAQRDLINFANRYSGPTNLWYLNTAFDRLVWDNLQEWADPDAVDAFRRRERKRLKDFGQTSWFPQGANMPQRLPDLTTALGGAR